MKRTLSLILVAVTILLSACEREEIYHPYVFQGRWVSVANSKGPALNLWIDDESITVKNGSHSYKPFTSDDTWDYYMNSDSVLFITRYSYDSDGGYDSDTRVLSVSFRDNYNTLILEYNPVIGADRVYTLIRRK